MLFLQLVAQLPFLCNRTGRVVQMAVAFLTRRVQGPDEDDWGNLRSVVKYLNRTKIDSYA